MDEQYKALRCATFHAKGHRKVLLPGSLGDREQVGQALESLTRLVIDLAPTVVKTKYLGGALTSAGFEGLYVAPKVGKMELFAARHDHGKLAERVALDCQYVGRLDDQGFEYGFLGEAAVSEIAGRPFDALVALSPGAGGPAPPLDLSLPILPINADGADRFQALLACALHNLRQPKQRFPH